MTNSRWLTVETTCTAIRHCIERIKTVARLISLITLAAKGRSEPMRLADGLAGWPCCRVLAGREPRHPPAGACPGSF